MFYQFKHQLVVPNTGTYIYSHEVRLKTCELFDFKMPIDSIQLKIIRFQENVFPKFHVYCIMSNFVEVFQTPLIHR